MNQQLQQVAEFHAHINATIHNTPTVPDETTRHLRATLTQEESSELVEALLDNHSIDKIAKEIADVLYTTYGTIISYGLQDKIIDIFNEVHTSNMSKRQNNKDNPVPGKGYKGSEYTEADVKQFLQ